MNNPNHIAIDLETMTFSSGRNTGKSALTAASIQALINNMSLAAPSFKVVDTAPVDGVCWYTIACNTQIGKWVREQDNAQWYEHGFARQNFHNPRANFDVHVELFTMLKLTWGDV